MSFFCHLPLLRIGFGQSMNVLCYFQYVKVWRGSYAVAVMFLSWSTCVGEYQFNRIFTWNSLLQLLLKGKADKYVLNDKDIDV